MESHELEYQNSRLQVLEEHTSPPLNHDVQLRNIQLRNLIDRISHETLVSSHRLTLRARLYSF